jgi:hypothetical protein
VYFAARVRIQETLQADRGKSVGRSDKVEDRGGGGDERKERESAKLGKKRG